MEGGKRIFLLRHGDTGLGGRYIGSSDVPISEKGGRQLAELAPEIAAQDFDLVLVSPLRRCLQSLDILGLAGEVCPLLREIDFGRWEGRNFAEISTEDPELAAQWAAGRNFSFPEGESIASFQERIRLVAARLYREDASRILILAHGGVVRFLLCQLLGISLDNYLLFDVAPGRLTELCLHSQGAVLRRFNCGG